MAARSTKIGARDTDRVLFSEGGVRYPRCPQMPCFNLYDGGFYGMDKDMQEVWSPVWRCKTRDTAGCPVGSYTLVCNLAIKEATP